MQLAAGVGQHRAGVELRPFGAVGVLRVFVDQIGVAGLPVLMGGRFDGSGEVTFLHGLGHGGKKGGAALPRGRGGGQNP
ncbi:hypothetical protein G6F64_015460 [Rhizopus arrhizus]|uniref:Uncharacterized protein n=1 Tax=Rhizopus oryzae TaxID=64495 RepID=A0A9P6WRC5_RHIOR|nr:hypothetical protein G6F64_015460 [Rhizopus arrhizus]